MDSVFLFTGLNDAEPASNFQFLLLLVALSGEIIIKVMNL